jgi:zinc protease
MPARFETNGAVAGMLSELVRNGVPLDWYATFARRINAVTAADVGRVAQKYITPDTAQVVVVGDRASIEEKVKELGLGPIEARGRTGEAIPAEAGGAH